MEDAPSESIPYSVGYLIQGEKKIWIGVSRVEGLTCERYWDFSTQVGKMLLLANYIVFFELSVMP